MPALTVPVIPLPHHAGMPVESGTFHHCYCTNVTRKRVLRAIAEQGCRTVDEVAAATRACTGCRTCRPELETLLNEVAAGVVVLPPGSKSCV